MKIKDIAEKLGLGDLEGKDGAERQPSLDQVTDVGAFTLPAPSDERGIEEVRRRANRIIELLEKEGMPPDSLTLLAMVKLVMLHSKAVTSDFAHEALKKKEAGELPRALEIPSGPGRAIKGKDGQPLFMVPGPKTVQ